MIKFLHPLTSNVTAEYLENTSAEKTAHFKLNLLTHNLRIKPRSG